MSGKEDTLKRFRSGSIENDNSPFSLSVNEGRSRSYSTNEADHVRSSSPAPSKRSEIEGLKQALFRTSSLQTGQSQSSPLSGGSATCAANPERKAYKKQPAGTFVYAVQEGDTLSKIAARFEVTPSLLMKANKLLSRTVFVGQSLFIPTVGYCSSAPPTPRNISPTLASEQGDSPAIIVNAPTEAMGLETPAPLVPAGTTTGPAAGASTDQHKAGKESQPRFLRLPARRLLEEDDQTSTPEGLTVRGTMLVTPNSIMFDPDVNDPHVISGDELQKYGVVVYMEEIKGVALYHDLSPKLFWQQTQQIRAQSPRPETYRSKQGQNSEVSPSISDSGSPARKELTQNTLDVTDGAQDLRPNTHGLPAVPTAELESQLIASLEKLATTSGNERSHVQNKYQRKSSEDIESVDILHPEPVAFSDQSPLLPTNYSRSEPKQEVVLIKPSPVKPSGATEPTKSSPDKINVEPLPSAVKTEEGHIKSNNHSSNSLSSAAGSSSNLSSSPHVSQILLTSDTGVTSPLTDQTDSLPSEKKSSSRRNSWSKKKKPTAIGKLASQVVVNFAWGPTIDQKENSVASIGPVSAFAPIHSIGQIKREIKLQFKSEFTLEDMSKVLGPDPREYLMKSDCALFESPLYLQIRRGVPKNDNMFQPRAFDHRNVGPPLSEYWFIVPLGLGDKVYHFLMAWQPDVYGDQEETHSRDELFYDVESSEGQQRLAARRKIASAGSRSPDDESKSWEILSKDEVYGAEKDELYRQEDIDESCIPELLGTTLIIQREHLLAILRSLPLNMTVGFNWRLVYATHSHGYSLQNLYVKTEAVEQDTPLLLVIMDASNCVFGAYLSNNLRIHDTFYGTGLTYLFTFHPKFKKFPWHGDNRCFIHGTRDFIAIGCGEKSFGLWLDESLDKGRSQKCPTFQNEVLGLEEDFRIVQLEVWRFEESHYC